MSRTIFPTARVAAIYASSDECKNLWLRPSGAEPWEYDVIPMHTTPTTWTFKRDA